MRSRLLVAAALGLLLFVAALVAEHAGSDLSPGEHMISEYANEPSGRLMEVGFAAWAASWALIGATVLPKAPGTRGRVAFFGCVLAALGVGVVAVFHTQAVAAEVPVGVARSASGRMHDLGGTLILLGGLVAAFAFAGEPAVSGSWRTIATTCVALGVSTSVVLLLDGDPSPGWRQRVLVVAIVGWQACVLRALAGGRSQSDYPLDKRGVRVGNH